MKRLLTIALFIKSLTALAQQPVSCTATLPVYDDVRIGEITSEVRVAKEYYIDNEHHWPLEVGRRKLDSVVNIVFTKFINKRTAEYKSVKCHYTGVDWNKPGGRSTKTISCAPGFTFVRESLVRTQNGDWKGGPDWGINNTTLSWTTGGHRRSETHVDVDAVYFEIDKRVIAELNIARKRLFDIGNTYSITSNLICYKASQF